MKIAITGGSGYLGTLLTSRLGDVDRQVDILDVKSPSPESIARLPSDRFHFRRLDLTDPNAAQALAKYDAIVHLAALTSQSACEAEPERAERLNVLVTENVLRFRKPTAPLILMSTMDVYGEQAADKPIDETCDVCPVGQYAKTKSEAEFLVRGKVETLILRCAESFGYSPAMRHDLLVHRLLKDAAAGRTLELSPMDAHRPLVHARDVVETIVYSLSHWSRMKDQIFNVGNPKILLKREELEQVSKNAGARFTEGQEERYSYAKLRAKGVIPLQSLADGAAEILSYYRGRSRKEAATHGV